MIQSGNERFGILSNELLITGLLQVLKESVDPGRVSESECL